MNNKKEKKKLIIVKEPFIKKNVDGFVKRYLKESFSFLPFISDDRKEEVVTKEELEEKAPILLYIDEQMNATPYFNIETGLLRPKNSLGRKKEYPHEITFNKKITLDYNGAKIPIYLLFEKERFCYPSELKIDAKRIYQNTQNIVANYRNLEESKKGGWDMNMEQVKVWLWLIGGFIGIILLALYASKIFGISEIIFGSKEIVKQTTNTIIENVSKGSIVVP